MQNSVCWILLLQQCREGGWVKARGQQRTDSTHILAKIRSLSRTLCVAQTMVYVLNVLSEVAPDWVRTHVPVEWVERYGERLYHERLLKEEQERKQYVNQVGADGWMLLDALQAPSTLDWMKTLPAIITLRSIWEQQFESREQGGQWRSEPALPAAQLITSPYDLDARNGKKRATFWTGYKVHFTQTCDEDAPQLITHVQTTPAPFSDEGVLSALHAEVHEPKYPEKHQVENFPLVGIRWCAPMVLGQGGVVQSAATLDHSSPLCMLFSSFYQLAYQRRKGSGASHFPVAESRSSAE